MAKAKPRIYRVTHGADTKLVRAINRSQALTHVAESLIKIDVIDQDELVERVSKGAVVENAGK